MTAARRAPFLAKNCGLVRRIARCLTRHASRLRKHHPRGENQSAGTRRIDSRFNRAACAACHRCTWANPSRASTPNSANAACARRLCVNACGRLSRTRLPQTLRRGPPLRGARSYFPVNLAFRFSLNAVTPSRKSARDAQSANISASICSWDSNSFSSER